MKVIDPVKLNHLRIEVDDLIVEKALNHDLSRVAACKGIVKELGFCLHVDKSEKTNCGVDRPEGWHSAFVHPLGQPTSDASVVLKPRQDAIFDRMKHINAARADGWQSELSSLARQACVLALEFPLWHAERIIEKSIVGPNQEWVAVACVILALNPDADLFVDGTGFVQVYTPDAWEHVCNCIDIPICLNCLRRIRTQKENRQLPLFDELSCHSAEQAEIAGRIVEKLDLGPAVVLGD